MPADVYEVVALAARFWFLLLIGLIVWYSYRWYARERRARRTFLKELPDAGFVGEFVVMRSIGGLEEGHAIRVPFEGTLGMLRNNDIILEAPGVAPRHIYFRYERNRGLKMIPFKGNPFAADRLSSEDCPKGLYVVHGTRLYVGECELRLRMFEGYEVTPPVQEPVQGPARTPWNDPGMACPQGVYANGQPIPGPYYAPPAEEWEHGGYAPPGAARPMPARAAESPASPYGRRVRSDFAPTVQQDNPFRSRRSVPGLRRRAAHEEAFHTPEPENIIPARKEETPVQDAAPAAQTAVRPEPSAEPGFSAMREYARMMAQAMEQEAEAEARPAAAKPEPVQPAAPQAAPAAQPVQPAAQQTRPSFAPAGEALRSKAARAEAIHKAAAAPNFAPADHKLPDMVFEDALDPFPEEELFHPLMDEDDWDAWEEVPPPPQPAPAAVRRESAARPVQTAEEEDWPYLPRNDQWRAEGLFADLLDEDGTDAAALPGGAYGGRDLGSTTRRMLSRYLKGGGR